jgi:hypothetical protein
VECCTARFRKNALFLQETAVSPALDLWDIQGLNVLIPRTNATPPPSEAGQPQGSA